MPERLNRICVTKDGFLHFFYSGGFKLLLAAFAVGALVVAVVLYNNNYDIANPKIEKPAEEIPHMPFISHLDHIFISCADTVIDWKLLAAIAYVESKFDTLSVSGQGASGLMQLMPSTYRQMILRLGVEDTSAINTRLNVMAAVEYIRELDKKFSFINPVERINYVLGSYNSGYGRVFDAMRLAKKEGVNKYRWSNIEKIMLTMNQEHVYTDSLCRLGKFDGRETTTYVKKVNKKYNEYLRIDSVFKMEQVQNLETKEDYEAYNNN